MKRNFFFLTLITLVGACVTPNEAIGTSPWFRLPLTPCLLSEKTWKSPRIRRRSILWSRT
jgi:hypothetical protein